MLFGEGPQIKNIAADLNKLFRQGSLLNQIGQTVEGDSAADQGTSDLLAARDPVIQEISVGMSGEQSARYTVSGTPPLSLPNSLGKPLKAWSVDVLPYQEGSGDPAPDNVRPIHGTDKLTITTAGLNQLPTTSQSRTVSGITFTVNSDGTIHIEGTATATTWLNGGAPKTAVPAGTYTISGGVPNAGLYIVGNLADGTVVNNITIGGVDNGTGKTFTLTQNAEIYWQISVSNGATLDAVVKPMMAFGSTVLPFTPYLSPSQTVITLPQTVYTATIGSSGGESRQRKRVLNGNENWTGSNTSGIYMQFSDMKKLTSYTANNSMLCENLSVVSNNGSMTDFSISGYVDWVNRYPNQNWLYIRIDDNHPDATSVKQWLEENPVTIVYEIAVTDEFALSASDIPTPRGTATTWATAEDGTVDSMEVTYVGKA